MSRSAVDYIRGYYDCFVNMRGEPPVTIEVTEELYDAYARDLMDNLRFVDTPSYTKGLLYKNTVIKRGFSGWSARGLSA